jgi:hypothetical protein
MMKGLLQLRGRAYRATGGARAGNAGVGPARGAPYPREGRRSAAAGARHDASGLSNLRTALGEEAP